MNEIKPLVLMLMGPTASGKTELAESLYQKIPVDLISVDSTMVYKGLNIGAAKPTTEELRKTPYQLIDIHDPSDPFSAGAFVSRVGECLSTALSNRRVPLLVGGTMMYFNRLLNPMADLPIASSSLRKQIEQEAQEQGWCALHEQLKIFDNDSYQRIHENDTQRIQRAIEVYRITGRSITSLQKEGAHESPYRFVSIILEPEDRKQLHERIKKRLEVMFEQGFIEEVRRLYQRGDLHDQLPSIRSVGYRQVWHFLQGKLAYDDLFNQVLYATRQLAKRQLTWLRRWPDAHRFFIEDSCRVEKIIDLIKSEVFL
jgi:tRNA dimethylallyltransferase